MSSKGIIVAGSALLAIFGSGIYAAQGSATRAASAPASEAGLRTPKAKVSYGMGATMARSFKRDGVEIELDALTMGLRDGLEDKKLLLTDEELKETATAFQTDLRQKRAQNAQAAAERTERDGQAFLAANGKKRGVVTLPSGLQYTVLQAGAGKTPKDDDTVECRYRGTFINGTEFDASETRRRPDGTATPGAPATFNLGAVIEGWREALKLMPVGSRWHLVVPPNLAYGERGFGGKKGAPRLIGPNTTLVFELELVAIKPPSSVQAQTGSRAAHESRAK